MQTIDAVVALYEGQAAEYARRTQGVDMGPTLQRFADKLPAGSLVVDAGCGSGRDTVWLQARGFRCYSYDASPQLCGEAQQRIGATPVVACHRHDALALPEKAAGILASASLLFLSDEDLAVALQTMAANLTLSGVLYASFKSGNGWQFADNKWFRHLLPEDIGLLADLSGLVPVSVHQEADSLGRAQGWTSFMLQQKATSAPQNG